MKANILFLSLLNLPTAVVVKQNFSAVSAESTITSVVNGTAAHLHRLFLERYPELAIKSKIA